MTLSPEPDPTLGLSGLLAEIDADIRATAPETGVATLSPTVRAALLGVPRQCFVETEHPASAYLNTALPIGQGQTISQPFIVALMTELLALTKQHRVLEIGCGSGYQAAILGKLAGQVWSLERIPELADTARARLARLGYDNVNVVATDGYLGFVEQAPYDAIMVTAAATDLPPALWQQLKPGGRLVIPIGPEHATQDLRLLTKSADGALNVRSVLPVVFVPFRH